jgi:hypothetical protein
MAVTLRRSSTGDHGISTVAHRPLLKTAHAIEVSDIGPGGAA